MRGSSAPEHDSALARAKLSAIRFIHWPALAGLLLDCHIDPVSLTLALLLTLGYLRPLLPGCRFKRSEATKILQEVLESKMSFTNERDKKGCAHHWPPRLP